MAAPQKSLAPIWLTLGFAAGVGFGWLVFQDSRPRPYLAPPFEVKASPVGRDAGTLAALEADFQRWGGYAVWEDDVTEMAAWDPGTKRHSDYYEVRRVDGLFFFRSIPRLTRPLIDHGPRGALPFAFTEPPWMRDQFYRENPRYEATEEPIVTLPPRAPERFAPGEARPRSLSPRPPVTPGGGL